MPADSGETPWRLYSPSFIARQLERLGATEKERYAVLEAIIALCESPAGTDTIRVVVAEGPAGLEPDNTWPADLDRYIALLPGRFILTFELYPRGIPPIGGPLLVPRALTRL